MSKKNIVKFIAETKNFTGNVLFEVGDPLGVPEEKIEHCCGGKKECLICDGTDRKYPPKYFVEQGSAPMDLDELKKRKEERESESLREQIKKLGKSYDPRWGKDKLENALLLAKSGKGG